MGVGLAPWLVALALFVAPAGARAAGTVYAGEQNLNVVAQYAIGAGGRLSPLTPPSIAAGREPLGVAVSPDGRSVYVTNVNDSTVSQYDVNPVTGALSPKTPATVASRLFPNGVAVTPDGKSVYVTNFDFAVSQYDVDQVSGVLSPKTPARVAAGPNPAFVAVTPDGRSAYASNFFAGTFGGSVSQYSIDPVTGALSPKTPATVAAAGNALGVAVSPNGRSAYVACAFDLCQYDIDRVSGALSPKNPPVVSVPGPFGVAVSPNGESVYAANGFGLSQFDIDPVSGALSPKTPATVATGFRSLDVAVTPDGKSVYVTGAGSGALAQFDVGPNGSLSAKTPATVPADSERGIAVGPLPRVPTSKEQCKNGGWRSFPQFRNQGQCVAFVERGSKP